MSQIDQSDYESDYQPDNPNRGKQNVTKMIWSNSRRKDATNHLPNSAILDSKWTLALLQTETLLLGGQTVETEMFSSRSSFESYLRANKLAGLHVLKDAASNGAGGIWILSPSTSQKFLSPSTPLTNVTTTTPKYVLQKYSLPPMLVNSRKAHVRLYALLSIKNSRVIPYISKTAFLHLSNKEWTAGEEEDDEVHISNCCANSGNGERFAGEVCVDLEERSNDPNDYNFYQTYGLIRQTIRTTLLPFTTYTSPSSPPPSPQFSYLGIDVIISRTPSLTKIDVLEINAPPSLDTATGLKDAEMTHEKNVKGIVEEIVLGRRKTEEERVWHNLVPIPPEVTVEKENAPTTNTTSQRSESIMRMKYALLERRFAKTKTPPTPSLVQNWCRSQFQYYTSSTSPPSFFENAGGAQVPSPVTSSMLSSLSNRWRSNHGALQKSQAVTALQHLLGFSPSEFDVDLNVNSTMIFKDLARICVQELVEGDEIVVSTSNHCANYDCWIEEAEKKNIKVVKWDVLKNMPHHPHGWFPTNPPTPPTSTLLPPITPRTKILVIPHSSNVLGVLAPLPDILPPLLSISPKLRIITDGVAAAPHRYVGPLSSSTTHYVVSLHKLFGPHLGVCFTRKSHPRPTTSGTPNFEACSGCLGLLSYFLSLSSLTSSLDPSQTYSSILSRSLTVPQSRPLIQNAFHLIELSESLPSSLLLDKIRFKWPNVNLISHFDDDISFSQRLRLPLITFYHTSLPSSLISEMLKSENIVVRNGTFLSDEPLKCWCDNRRLGFEEFKRRGGAVRVSIAHYNTREEVERMCEVLEGIEGW
ncbi:hypothetical protein TrST_g9314 [Triparma strigata]|uniref:Aminotransferase class V domain-containing protein n=1 Tax=Triparma strigata TaxID=1606541 RepID=A0A9W7F2C2_9STRA|nr:hypothetical protein TrST_g9314 [Triparma strigata]